MKLNKILRGAFLTAVHEDMMARETRRKNIIISGLPLAHCISDTALVDDLIESEFGFRPLIARTRQLERRIDGYIQPIAVTLSAINDATYLVDNAKMLRKSNSDNFRQHIYINRDMTKAVITSDVISDVWVSTIHMLLNLLLDSKQSTNGYNGHVINSSFP